MIIFTLLAYQSQTKTMFLKSGYFQCMYLEFVYLNTDNEIILKPLNSLQVLWDVVCVAKWHTFFYICEQIHKHHSNQTI